MPIRPHVLAEPDFHFLRCPQAGRTDVFAGRRQRRSRTNHIEADVVPAILAGERLRQRDHAGLAGAVNAFAEFADPAASEAMLTTVPPERLIIPSNTARVQLIMPHRLTWTSCSHSARGFSTRQAVDHPTGIVDKNVDRSALLDGSTMAWTSVQFETSAFRHRLRCAARQRFVGHHLRAGLIDIGDRHRGAFLGKGQRDAAPNLRPHRSR